MNIRSGYRTRLLLRLACLLLATALPVSASEPAAWYRTELDRLTAGSGRWIADNAAFRSDDEPFDAYGIAWRKAAGGSGATGRLFALRGGEEVAEFWQFRIYWDAAESGAVTEQFSGSGAFGRGLLVGFGEATLNDQMFTDPDGTQRRELHHAWFEGDIHVTRSFHWRDGGWTPARTYRWKHTPGDDGGSQL